MITYAFAAIGIDLYPLSETQLYNFETDGTYEMLYDSSEFQPGDLIYYVNLNCGTENCPHRNEIHHVGIYLGNGDILEANVEQGVIVRKMNEVSDYFIRCGVRVLKN